MEWLEGLAEAMALRELRDEDVESKEGEKKVEQRQRTIIRQLITREEQQRSARIIRRAWKGSEERYGLTKVIGPGANGERVEFTEQEGIEGALLDKINAALTNNHYAH
jgi:hypothetical protein